MNSYTISTMNFRNHGSCCFNDFGYLNQITEISGFGFYPIHGNSLYPIVSYGLKQSTLINCSRRVLGGNGSCRVFNGRDHRYGVLCNERRERRRLACLVWEREREREERGSNFDVGVEEILSLLDNGSVGELGRRNRSIGAKFGNVGCSGNGEESSKFGGKSLQKIEIEEGGLSEIEKRSRIIGKLDGRSKVKDEAVDLSIDGRRNLRVEEIFDIFDSFSSSSDNKPIKSREKYRSSKFGNSLRINDYEEKEEGFKFNRSLSSSDGYENNKKVMLTSDQGLLKKKKVRISPMQKGEGNECYTGSLSNYENNVRIDLGQEGISFFREKQFQKHDNGRYDGESSTKTQTALEEIAGESMKQKVTTKRNDTQNNSNVSSIKAQTALEEIAGESMKHKVTTKRNDTKNNTNVSSIKAQTALEEIASESMKQKVTVKRSDMENYNNFYLATKESDSKWVTGKQSELLTGTTMGDKEENSTSVIVDLGWKSREQVNQTEQQVSGKCESWRQNRVESEIGVDPERYSAPHNEQFDQTEKRVCEKCESWRQNKVELESVLVDKTEIYNSQPNYISKTGRLEESSDRLINSLNTTIGASGLMPPSSQPMVRGSMETVTGGQPVASADPIFFVEPRLSGSGITYTNRQREMQKNSHKLDSKINKDENSRKRSELITTSNDALASAICLRETSEKFVVEFAEKVKQEILFSHESQRTSKHSFQMEMERSSETTTSASTVNQHAGSSKMISDNFQMKKDGNKRSSGGLRNKRPSLQLEAPEKGLLLMTSGGGSTEGSSTLGNSITRRSSQTLWSYITQIVRKGWLKIGTRTSSIESGSSEAWFPGHEPDDSENVKKDKNGMSRESLAAKNQADQSYTRRKTASLNDRKTPIEATSILEPPLVRESPSKGSFSVVSGKETFGRIEAEMVTLGSQFIIDSSKQEISESNKTKGPLEKNASSSLTIEIVEESRGEKPTEGVWIEGKKGKLKKRMFKQNTQVQNKRFEEWEEAFELETEQTKADEMFMREALLEARKAADTWEVPVGAVLVQDGKIIARGFNLVEDKRDSTAHAEMICIREASNLLRTWRLAGTTLYVTLEPCPMCAGAILQARINTLVWGAPNKLLGADGSWISLFPRGEEGRNSSDQSDRMVAPVPHSTQT